MLKLRNKKEWTWEKGMNFTEELIKETVCCIDSKFDSLTLRKFLSVLNAINSVLAEDRKEKYPLFLRIDEDIIINIVKRIISEPEKKILVGIAGESACGKTTFVNSVMSVFKGERNKRLYTTICTDDYYKDTSEELLKAGSYEELFKSGFSFDTPEAFNLDLMKEHLISLRSGNNIKSPSYDFVTCKSTLEVNIKESSKVILNEGLYVLTDKLKDIMDIKVYIFTPYQVIKDRWFKRAETRGKTGEAARIQFEDVNNAAKLYIRPALNYADIIISGLCSESYIINFTQKLVKAIENALIISDKR